MADEVGKTEVGGSEVAAFVRQLEAYGGHEARWPADRQAAARALLGRSDAAGHAARRALAEARALDQVLASAPAVDAIRIGRLADRIVATARLAPLPLEAGANIVDFDRMPSRRGLSAVHRSGWAAAALLAASLLVGIFVGPGSEGVPALREAADAVGLGGYLDQLALGTPEDGGLPDEDVL
jgi:hypothetical protein